MRKLLIIPFIIICISYPHIIFCGENVINELNSFKSQIDIQIRELYDNKVRYKDIFDTYISTVKIEKAIDCLDMYESIDSSINHLSKISVITYMSKYVKEEHKKNYYNDLINAISIGNDMLSIIGIVSSEMKEGFKNNRRFINLLDKTNMDVIKTKELINNEYSYLIKLKRGNIKVLQLN
jgi:hypothetical protein